MTEETTETKKTEETKNVTYVQLTQEQFDALVKGKEQINNKNITDEAREAMAKEQQEKSDTQELENAIKFNMSIKDFVEKNKAVLPEESEKIIETVEGKTFANASEKSNAIKKSMIEAFVKIKENIDKLPDSLKGDVNLFNSLTEAEKTKQAKKFWTIVEVGTQCKVLARKAEQLQNNGGYSAAENSAYETRFLDLSKKFYKENN